MRRPAPRPCPFCKELVKFSYPANDPENGPAGFYCGKSDCQTKEMEAEWEALSPEEKQAALDEQAAFDAMYAVPGFPTQEEA